MKDKIIFKYLFSISTARFSLLNENVKCNNNTYNFIKKTKKRDNKE